MQQPLLPYSYVFGRFELQPSERRLLADGEVVALGPRALDLLVALVGQAGHLLSKEVLLERVWPGLVVEESNLQVQVSTLRKVLGSGAIETVAKRGYRFAVALDSIVSAGATLEPLDERTPSIAVLPFVNLSDDIANEHFADGLAEELLNVLSKVRGLRVASRTSAFYFKGKDVDLATVARKLNVGTILEGSVRKSGNQCRISVQLIAAATDSHLWSATYDRELADVFAIQDAIAESIVTALRPALLGTDSRAFAGAQVAVEIADASKGRTANGEALELYFEGRLLGNSNLNSNLTRALECYERALAIDPDFASAWVGVATVHASLAGYGGHTSVCDGFRHARTALERALDLEPDLPAAHSILSWLRMYCDWDWKGSEASARRALELAPNDVTVLYNATIVAGNLGRDDEEAALAGRAVLLDPLDARCHQQIALLELDATRLDAADEAITRTLELDPWLALTNFTLGQVRLAQGRMDEALAAFQQEGLDDYRLLGVTLAQHARGAQAESAAALAELVERYSVTSPCQIADAHAGRGESGLAFEWLDRAFDRRDPRLVEIKTDSMLRSLHQDPRWGPLLHRMGLTE